VVCCRKNTAILQPFLLSRLIIGVKTSINGSGSLQVQVAMGIHAKRHANIAMPGPLAGGLRVYLAADHRADVGVTKIV
jgi:hypothetical protein